MKRRNFVTVILAALGVGAAAGSSMTSRVDFQRASEKPSPPPAPPCKRCGGRGEIIIEKPEARNIASFIGGYLPVPFGAVYESHHCPLCRPTSDDIYTSPAA